MSIYKSLKTNKFRQERRVRKRYERIQKLIRTQKWVEGMSPYGLPKEKIQSIKDKLRKAMAAEKREDKQKKEAENMSLILDEEKKNETRG